MSAAFAHSLSELERWYRYRPLGSGRYVHEILLPQAGTLPREGIRRWLDDGALGGGCLFEADMHLRKALVTFLAYKHLMSGGYLSWGLQTLYYALFYAVGGLCRIQATGFVHVPGQGIVEFLPTSFPGVWELQRGRSRGSTHRLTWELFRRGYAQFSHPRLSDLAEVLGRTDDDAEADYRNMITYDLQFGYAELHDPAAIAAAHRVGETLFVGDDVPAFPVPVPAGLTEPATWSAIRLGMDLLHPLLERLRGHGLDVAAYGQLVTGLSAHDDTRRLILSQLQAITAPS